ncbi:hypothetical protein HAX54_004202, partial [Datura stramonium]|nr:hypothetical protein [Datura stramonium]
MKGCNDLWYVMKGSYKPRYEKFRIMKERGPVTMSYRATRATKKWSVLSNRRLKNQK